MALTASARAVTFAAIAAALASAPVPAANGSAAAGAATAVPSTSTTARPARRRPTIFIDDVPFTCSCVPLATSPAATGRYSTPGSLCACERLPQKITCWLPGVVSGRHGGRKPEEAVRRIEVAGHLQRDTGHILASTAPDGGALRLQEGTMAMLMISDSSDDTLAHDDHVITALEAAGHGQPPGRQFHVAARKGTG